MEYLREVLNSFKAYDSVVLHVEQRGHLLYVSFRVGRLSAATSQPHYGIFELRSERIDGMFDWEASALFYLINVIRFVTDWLPALSV